jgi:hypothetical protein
METASLLSRVVERRKKEKKRDEIEKEVLRATLYFNSLSI